MIRKLGLATILSTFACTAVVACGSANEADPIDDTSTGDGSVDASKPSSDASDSVDSSTLSDAGQDARDSSSPSDSGSDADAGCGSNQYNDGSGCKPCSGACAAGSYESAACSATADRVCSTCTAISDCSSVTCTTASDQVCNTCGNDHYLSGGACLSCSGACSAGTYQSAACSASADRACTACTAIPNCASPTCTTANDQTCAACDGTHFLSGGTCNPCSGACPAGEHLTAACSANADRVCTTCTPIANCTNISCTTTSDQVCTGCASNYYLDNNACVACSGACADGSYQSAACSATADRVCSTCTAVTGCTSDVTCTTDADSQCTSCAAGSYLVEGTADTCATCSGACPAGKYETAACSSTADLVCSDCTAIANCAATVTCTNTSNQQCSACSNGYSLLEGTADTCLLTSGLPKTCAELKKNAPATADGVYTIDPDGTGPIGAFNVYCDMTNNGGGWTLIGKVGNGKWPELTNQQYIDLFANPIADVNEAELQTGALPPLKTIAFYRKDKTNAIYHATPFGVQSVVRVNWDSAYQDSQDGSYFQQRKIVDSSWDFWSAIRDSRRWNSNGSTVGDAVANYGTDFVLARALNKFDTATNVVTHDAEGDTSFGWWDASTITLADGSSLGVSRHGGLLCDGVAGFGWFWIMTTNPTEAGGRFRAEQVNNKSTIWLR